MRTMGIRWVLRALCAALAFGAALPAAAQDQPEPATIRVSTPNGGGDSSGSSSDCSVAEEGRAVSFWSAAGDLVARDDNLGFDGFVYDAGSRMLEWVRSGPTSRPAEYVHDTDISRNGRFLAVNAELGRRRSPESAILLHDRKTGVTTRASDRSDGRRNRAGGAHPSLSGNGRYVAFVSYATDLAMRGDDNQTGDIFVHDRRTKKTNRVSLTPDLGDPNAESNHPSISRDGRFVAYESRASNLVDGDDSSNFDVFVYDRERRTTRLASVSSDGEQLGGNEPAISGTGRYVAFSSYVGTVSGVDRHRAVFVHDLATGVTEEVSVGPTGPGNASSDSPSISDDGRFVAFVSLADNLVVGDTNGGPPEGWDVFVRDRAEGTTTRVSVGDEGQQTEYSVDAAISGDGSFVCWSSFSDDAVRGDSNGHEDVFLRGPLF